MLNQDSLEVINKYTFYENAVQNPKNEVAFMSKWFLKLRKREAKTLREDFCGTAAISHHWVKKSKLHRAIGVDLDPETIELGKILHGIKLSATESKRLLILKQNVLVKHSEKVDILCAFNFSYFIFQNRKDLLSYFKGVRETLKSDGVFFIDLFGGPDSQKIITDKRVINKDLIYYWDCQEFNPITAHCRFAIHFKYKNKLYRNVFTYDWRLWTLAELREILSEAGFRSTQVFWEGDGKDGQGDGIFRPTETAENSLAWVSYIAALK